MINKRFFVSFAQEDRDTIAYRGTRHDYFIVKVVIHIELLNEYDTEILLFVNKYKYVKISDFKYLYSNKQYYQIKVKYLIHNNYLRKIKWYIVLGSEGKKYLESLGYHCSRISYEKTFVERQKIVSSFAARYYNNKKINFIPSMDLKDKQIFTITSRRFIGLLNIDKTDYLIYYISKKHTDKYIQSVIYDIRKEHKYKNVIVFVEDLNKININNFIFGINKLYIIPNTENNIHLLEKIHRIDYKELFSNVYKDNVYLSEYTFCDYYTKSGIFVFPLPFLDTEKLSTIKYFLMENKNKKVDILYSKNISLLVTGKLKGANYKPIDFDKYVKGDFNIYD